MFPRFIQIDKIFTFFSKRSGREKILVAGAVFTVSALVFKQMILDPVARTFEAADHEMRDLQLEIQQTVQILAQKNQIDDELSRYGAFAGEAKTSEEESISLLKHVEELAKKAGVNLIYVKPAEEKTEGRIKKYSVSLECESESQPLIRFFYEVESSPLLLRVEKYSLVPLKDGSRVMKISAVLSHAVISY